METTGYRMFVIVVIQRMNAASKRRRGKKIGKRRVIKEENGKFYDNDCVKIALDILKLSMYVQHFHVIPFLFTTVLLLLLNYVRGLKTNRQGNHHVQVGSKWHCSNHYRQIAHSMEL